MSRSNEWDAAHRLAGEIPTCTGPAKHRAISALPVSYTHLDVYKRQAVARREEHPA